MKQQSERKKKTTTKPNISAANKVGDSFHSNKTENFTFQTMDRDRDTEFVCLCTIENIQWKKRVWRESALFAMFNSFV